MSQDAIFSQLNNDPMVRELLPVFDNALDQRLKELRSHIDVGDLGAIAGKAHSIKGSAGFYGYEALALLAQRLEGEALEHRTLVELDKTLAELGAMAARIRAGISVGISKSRAH